jgi:predicted HTH transcriptional regulator
MIIRLLQENPSLSASALAKNIGISPRVAERHIRKLKEEGILFREGSHKGGKWVVVQNNIEKSKG